MTVTMPTIDISFKQKSSTLVERSERGIAILILNNDTTLTDNVYNLYTDITELEEDKANYTSANYQFIEDVMTYSLYEVIVVNEATIAESLAKIPSYADTGWITIAGGATADFTILNTWIKAQKTAGKTYKCVSYKSTAPDCDHIVNFYNDYVTFADSSRGKVTGENYTPSLIGILASCNVTRGATYYKCSNLSSVTEVADNNAALQAGNFILFNDGDYVRVAQSINSMTTTNGTTATEDMKYIETIEAMDLILDDIRETFKEDYCGNYKNKYDNQMLFISAVNTYLADLEDEDVLDDEYENTSDINVDKQRSAWVSAGKSDASTWTEAVVRKTSYKRSVFLSGSIKILGSMTNLAFEISLY